MRKAAREGLSKSVVESFKAPQLNEAILFTNGLLAQPATWDSHLRRTTASMVSELDSSVKDIKDFVARLTRAALPGSHFVEFFPWMMYIQNGSVTRSIGTRGNRSCSRIYSMEYTRSWSVSPLSQRLGLAYMTLVERHR